MLKNKYNPFFRKNPIEMVFRTLKKEFLLILENSLGIASIYNYNNNNNINREWNEFLYKGGEYPFYKD